MALFSGKNTDERIGVIIEIGSGSVGMALVVSTPNSEEPIILWSRRERAALKDSSDLQAASKLVLTALVNISLDFETSGRTALREYRPRASIDVVQCVIAAPWTHTISKKIIYKQDKSFVVTDELLKELVATAIAKSKEEIKETEITTEMGVGIASRATLYTLLNGYKTKNPVNQKAKELVLLHTTVVCFDHILSALKELHEKVFREATLETYSSALSFHCVANDIAPQHRNMSLVDITHEATEMSVVRAGELSHVAHIATGLYSVAREIAAVTKIPLEEALGHLKTSPATLLKALPKTQGTAVEEILDAYVADMVELFSYTGDELATPRQFVLHVESPYETFMIELLNKATKQSIKSDPVVVQATSLLFNQLTKKNKVLLMDSVLLVGIYFFHTGNQCVTIDHE